MLVEFSVTNFRSIRDKQTLSMVKGKGHEHEATHTFKPTAPGSETLLKSAAIYGANAAGKSNIIKAISTMRKIVVESAKGQLGDKLPVTPFMFDPETPKQPSEFEALFIVNNVRYQYGFSATKERIYSEWLFAYPKGRAQRWFERNYDSATDEYTWHLDANLKGEKKVWRDSTRSNALFLSVATQLNSVELKPIYHFIDKSFLFLSVDDSIGSLSKVLFISGEFNEKIVKMARLAGFPLGKINTPLVDDALFNKLFAGGKRNDEIEELLYKSSLAYELNGRSHEIPFAWESDGTKKTLGLIGLALIALERGRIMIVDEINNSLHPILVAYFTGLFNSVEYNPKNAQLIFTTHETSVLDQDIFRRDQIWFCEKDENHATRLYSLLDFKPRKGYENLEAAYLAGRYGAVPVINSL